MEKWTIARFLEATSGCQIVQKGGTKEENFLCLNFFLFFTRKSKPKKSFKECFKGTFALVFVHSRKCLKNVLKCSKFFSLYGTELKFLKSVNRKKCQSSGERLLATTTTNNELKWRCRFNYVGTLLARFQLWQFTNLTESPTLFAQLHVTKEQERRKISLFLLLLGEKLIFF